MSSSKVKEFSGDEFTGNEKLEVADVTEWTVNGLGAETAKAALDDLDWDGELVTGITLQTSPDNLKVVNANVFLHAR